VALKVTFPIGAKLVIIITALFFLSLGFITFLVALFISADVEETAVKNNFSINEMSSVTTEDKLSSLKSNSLVLLQNISLLSSLGDNDNYGDIVQFFYSQNADIAAIIIRNEDANGATDLPQRLLNERFFVSNDLSRKMIDIFLESNFQLLNRSLIGETIILNAAPVFNGVSLLALSFPHGGFSSVIVFFSSQSITESFGTGANSTFIINFFGDVLVHPDQNLIRDAANFLPNPFVKDCIASRTANFRERFKDESGNDFFGAAKKLSQANIIVISVVGADVVFEGINATTRRNIYLSIGVWFLSVLFLWFFSKSISGPLKALKDATEKIEQGDYRLKLSSKNWDETGMLTQSVQSMSNVLSNFEAFTNKTLARLAREGKLQTGGATKQATMFFSDIRSFTAISEKLTPPEVVEFLNEYMERMVS
jgi:adenylate cyclase